MDTVSLGREVARMVAGSAWHVDHASGTVVENLGRALPATLARNACEGPHSCPGYDVVPLPEKIRLPAFTPLPVGGRKLSRAATALWTVDYGCIMGRGVVVRRRAVSAVDFLPAPESLRGEIDYLAMNALLENESFPMRAAYAAGAAGARLDGPGLQTRSGWGPWTGLAGVKAFSSSCAAGRFADALALRLRAAAQWRKRNAA